MNYFSGPHNRLRFVVLLGFGMGLLLTPPGARAQSNEIAQILQGPAVLLLHSGSQGYLGVDLSDVDQEKAQSLKLKEVRGAVITLIDHDAPAGQIGLKVNDVVLALNGQTIEGSEQLRRMLKEIPAGRNVSLVISRDGNTQTLTVQLADRKVIEHDVRTKIGSGDMFSPTPGMGILTGDASLPGLFHMPIFGSSLNVGVMVEPLTSQMAEYLGVPSGLMVKQVARKSEAATAGLKAFDIILKVGPDTITNVSGWDRALRSNQGKPVQITILRDKKQQVVTLQVDSKHKSSLDGECVSGCSCPLMAEIDPAFAADAQAAADALADQARTLFQTIGPQQAAELRKQAEKLREGIAKQNFKIDQKQLDEFKQQLDQWRKSLNPQDFKPDSKQLEELRRQMEQWKRQMEELKEQEFGNRV
jgi:membrane-associated protease RseP (regulator of RpoE activity)